MAGKLSFSIAINLLTENFKKGSSSVKNAFRSIQAQILTFAAAMGFAGVSLSNFFSQLIQVARETSKAVTALKNVSGSTAQFADNLRYTTQLAQKYGVYVNDLTSNYAKFTAAASIAGMTMADQRKLFESLSRTAAGFGMSADDTNGMFLAVTQMMGKGKIQAEELRGQLGERLPIAMQAMAKAAGTTVAGLDSIMKKGQLLSAEVLPKFADALNEMLPNVDTDNIETSLNRLKNAFQEFTQNTGIQDAYKSFIDGVTSFVNYAKDKISTLVTFVISIVSGKLLVNIANFFNEQRKVLNGSVTAYERAEIQKTLAIEKRVKAAKLLEATQKDYEAIVNGQRMASEVQLEKAKTALKVAETNERKAIIAQQTAAENAASIKSMGFWKRTGAIIISTGERISMTLKAVWSTVWPMALITAIAGVIAKMREMYTEIKRINDIIPATRKLIDGSNNMSAGAEGDKLQQIKSIVDDINASTSDRKNALSQLNSILGTNYSWDEKTLSVQGDINAAVKERIRLLEGAAKVDALIQQKQNLLDRQTELENSPVNSLFYQQGFGNYLKGSKVGQYFGFKTDKQLNKEELENTQKAIALLDNQLAGAVKETLSNTPVTTGGNDDKEKKTPLQKEEEKYAASVKELTNKLNNRAITEEEYKKQLNDLNKATYETLSGMLTPEEAAKNKTYQTVKGFSVSSEFSEAQSRYDEELNNYSNQLKNGALTETDYQKAKLDLLQSTIKAIASMDNLTDAEKKVLDGMLSEAGNLQSSLVKQPEIKKYDSTFDYKKSDKEIKSGQLSIAKENLEKIKTAYNAGAKDLVDELNNAMTNVDSLEKALKIAEVKQDVKDFSKELNEGVYSGVKEIASSGDRLVSAFSSLRDVFGDEDATAWERIMAVWNAMINTVDAFMSIVKTIETLTLLTEKLANAKNAEKQIVGEAADVSAAAAGQAAKSAIAIKEIATSKTVTAAYKAEMAAKTAAAYAGIPFAGAGLAAAQIAAMNSLILASAIPGFTNGGFITYGSTTGDKTLARVNKGELILNGSQQATLFQLANGKGIKTDNGSGKVEFEIRYDRLVGVLKNGDQKSRRGR